MSQAMNGHNGEINGKTISTNKSAQLGPIESPTKPWYISSKALLRMVNKVSEAITDHDRTKFESAISGLTSVIRILAEKTASQSLVINLESMSELIDNIDALRSDQFLILNDGADDMRGRFARTLKELTSNIADQKKLAADYLNERAIAHSTDAALPSFPASFMSQRTVAPNNVDVPSSLTAAVPSVPSLASVVTLPTLPTVPPISTEMITQTSSTTYQKTMQYLHPVLEQVKLRFPKSYEVLALAVQQLQEAIGSKCQQVVNTVKQTIDQTDVVQLMLTAQPYAHAAYSNVAAVGASVTPTITAVVDPLRPYLEPLMQRAMEARAALIAHATMGPYITYALDRLYAAIELARLYCSIGDAPTAVLSALTGVPQVALPGLPDLSDISELPEVPEIPDVVAKAEGIVSHVPFASSAPSPGTTTTAPQDVTQIMPHEVKEADENLPDKVKSEVKNLSNEVKEEGVSEAVKGVAGELKEQVQGVAKTEEVPATNIEAMDSVKKHLNEARRALSAASPSAKGRKQAIAEKQIVK